MRKFHLLPAILLIGMVACNNAGDKTPANNDSTGAAKDSGMNKSNDSMKAAAVPALPAVPAGAKVYFKNLKNGQSVTSPFKVVMGVDGMKVDTAGPVVANSGHFHILVDVGDSIAAGQMIPKDSTHLHYGRAQTSTELKLAPGTHKLALEFADGLHRSYGGQMAATVSVTVKK
ncbi:MAG TPA: DUF4399 domain-containing protein [Puia sp.]|nr:DUF4399 domain-containing protein [Puia sp.]